MDTSTKPIINHLTDFLDWLDVEKGLSPRTQENYGRFLKKFLDWLKINNYTNLQPHELSPEIIWHYRVYLARESNKPLKKSTQNHYLIAIRALLNFFAKRDILSLPAEKIELPKIKEEKTVRFLTLEQLKKLFSAPDTATQSGLRDRAILESFFSTGMRISELTALDRSQVKIGPDAIELELGIIGKGRVARTVYFSKGAIVWLQRYLETRSDDEKSLFVNYRSRAGSSRRLTPRSIENIIKKYAVSVGLPATTTPHVLRHSFATDLLTQGVDLRTVQEFLGHKSITATQIYTHITSKRLRDTHRQFHSAV